MKSLAQLLPGYWEVEKEGYRFYFSREKKEARENWWRLFTEERNAAIRAVCSEAEKKIEDPLEEMRNEGGELDNPAYFEEQKLEQEVFSGLPDNFKKELFSRLDTRTFYRMSGGAIGMGANENNTLISFETLPAELRQRLTKRFRWQSNDVPKYVQYSNSGSALFAGFLSGKGRFMQSVHMTFSNQWTLVMRPNHEQLAHYVSVTKDNFPAGWTKLAKAHQTRIWENKKVPIERNGKKPARSDMQLWLVRHKNIEIISDFYSALSQRMTDQEKALAPIGTTEIELNRIASLHDVSWKQTGGVYLVRNNRWYRDDLLEVPEKRLEQIQRKANAITMGEMRKAALKTPIGDYMRDQLDALADAANTLSPWQLFNGLPWDITVAERLKKLQEANKTNKPLGDWRTNGGLPPFIADYYFTSFSDLIMEQYETLRWYATLDKKQRKALLEGTLLFGSMSQSQQQSLLYAQPLVKIALDNSIKSVVLKVVPENSEVLAATGICRVKIVNVEFEGE